MAVIANRLKRSRAIRRSLRIDRAATWREASINDPGGAGATEKKHGSLPPFFMKTSTQGNGPPQAEQEKSLCGAPTLSRGRCAWQRARPEVESSARSQNDFRSTGRLSEWTALLSAEKPNLSADHPASLDPRVLAEQCEMRMSRRSGPGGQNRNKVETAVILTHLPTGLTAQASERRSQAENRAVALKRLRLELALSVRRAIPQGSGRPYIPSPLWLSRCRSGRIAASPRHDDFPAMLAEALDVLHASSFDPRAAAQALGVLSVAVDQAAQGRTAGPGLYQRTTTPETACTFSSDRRFRRRSA